MMNMPDLKKTLKEVVAKTTKTLEIPKESIERMNKASEAMKEQSSTIPRKKA